MTSKIFRGINFWSLQYMIENESNVLTFASISVSHIGLILKTMLKIEKINENGNNSLDFYQKVIDDNWIYVRKTILTMISTQEVKNSP